MVQGAARHNAGAPFTRGFSAGHGCRSAVVRALPPTPNSLLLDHAPKVTPRLFSVSIFFAVALAVLRRPAFAPSASGLRGAHCSDLRGGRRSSNSLADARMVSSADRPLSDMTIRPETADAHATRAGGARSHPINWRQVKIWGLQVSSAIAFRDISLVAISQMRYSR